MKRLLLVTYYFPPSGGPGVQRSLKFTKYLPRYGWEATVLTVDPGYAAYPDIDEAMALEIPDDTRVVRTKARDPYAFYARMMGMKRGEAVGVGFLSRRRAGPREKIARWVRANLFIPDARIGWVRYAERAALKELESTGYDAIFSSGPPHSTHLVARSVARSTGLPWILDLRDAWPPDSYSHLLPTGAAARRRDEKMRAETLEAADCIVAVSDTLVRDTRALTGTRVELIPNGFDDDDFRDVEPIGSETFSIVYAGNMAAEQNPAALWQALKSGFGDWKHLTVRFVGNVAREVAASVERAGLSKRVSFIPYVEHKEAVRHICGADLLLLCINRVPNPAGIVTGKLYEYLASGRPVLCLAADGTDAAAILEATRAGRTFSYTDGAGVERFVGAHYEAWKKGKVKGGARRERIEVYSRRGQAGSLAGLLDEICGAA